MNKFFKFIPLVLTAFVFLGCQQTVKFKDSEKVPENKVKLVINAYSYNEARTVMPDINWDDYLYELKAIENYGEAGQKPETTLVDRKSKTELASGVTVNVGSYRFTLNAYKASAKVLSGTVTANLTASGNTTLNFKMYPVSGATGASEITVYFPQVSPVAKVKAAVSRDLFAAPDDAGAALQTVNIVAGEKRVIFGKDNLPSGVDQYAHMWFYDDAGNVIYTLIESIVVVGGNISTCERRLTDEDWRTYACSVVLKKDGASWASSKKSVMLVDKMDTNIRYQLKDISNGVFSANVAEGLYLVYINGEDTGIEFNSANEVCEVQYFTVSAGSGNKGCVITPVSGAIEDGEGYAIVQNGKDFVFTIELLRGYKTKSTGLTLNAGGVNVENPDFDSEYLVAKVNSSKTINVGGIEPIVYTITYNFGEKDAEWKAGYTKPVTFTAEEVVTLPTVADIIGDGGIFDVWVDSKDSDIVYKTTEGIYNNLSLVAMWKDSATVDTDKKQIYANGISLLIKEGSSSTETVVYIDLNKNGKIDADDYQLVAKNGTKNFTDYVLHAGTEDGKEIKSDFVFTMTGGQIRAIWGLDSKEVKHANKSVLNISGNARIGNTTGVVIDKDDEGNSYTTATGVEGVMLETISDEIINIVGSMTGNVICVTPYAYDSTVDRFIAYIGNSIWANYDVFSCYTDDRENSGVYNKNKLTMKNIVENGLQRTIIRLADPAGVALPKPDEIDGDVNLGFSLGDDRISAECSVFSLAVENGVFYFDQRTIFTPNTPDRQEKLGLSPEDCVKIEATLDYMIQPTINTYVKDKNEIKFKNDEGETQTYVYMHILSSGNQITPEIASDFLSQIKFRRTGDKEVKVKVNLETVPSTDIAEAGVKYFNGSFYKRITAKEWRASYNDAKASVFNQLHGYLMNITSEVENNYIYEAFGAGATAWMGASRVNNRIDGQVVYDAPAYASTGTAASDLSTGWYWQSGPEAGQMFWKTTAFTNINSRVPIDPEDLTKGYWYQKWDNSATLGSGFGAEPNNSNTEPCVQYLTLNNKEGTWNDIASNKVGSGDYSAMYAFVEYTPYENDYNIEEAKYQSITRYASY